MKLYHFTPFVRLPAILKEGITKGDVPLEDVDYQHSPNAANLTRNGSRHEQTWVGHLIVKQQVRLTVDVPTVELVSFKKVARKYCMSRQWVKALDPKNHRKDWFFSFDGVKPHQIKSVEILRGGNYKKIEGDDLQQFISAIDAEFDNLIVTTIRFGPAAGANAVRVKPGRTTWLFPAIMS